MQITRHFNTRGAVTHYTTEDQQTFYRIGDARGHAKRLAVASYLKILRNNLMRETGSLDAAELAHLTPRVKAGTFYESDTDDFACWTDDIQEILQDLPAMVDAPKPAANINQYGKRRVALGDPLAHAA